MAINESENRPTFPRSIRHKRILDTAAAQPEAAIETIAEAVPSVTPQVVEQVLEEYGDPAADHSETALETGNQAMAQRNASPDLGNVSAKQRELLRAIDEHPRATQRELADVLDVSASTISNRANSIEGFDWENRQEFVETAFESEATQPAKESPKMSSDTEYRADVDQLAERVAAIEEQVTAIDEAAGSRTAFDDPELAHKVVHACLKSDVVTEEEELQILKSLLR